VAKLGFERAGERSGVTVTDVLERHRTSNRRGGIILEFAERGDEGTRKTEVRVANKKRKAKREKAECGKRKRHPPTQAMGL